MGKRSKKYPPSPLSWRFEAGATQPSLDVLKKLATSMNVTIDSLVLGEGECDPSDDLRLQFEAVFRMPEEERKIVKALLEA
jgi:transcriptional regulator with XRE-family HTH domain